ncbi:MAG: tyrosine-type recombinase/integrase [Bacteroidota bacterium]
MFDEQLTAFLQYLRFEKRYSPNTLVAYQRDLTYFREYLDRSFGTTEIGALTHFHIRGWLAEAKEARQTARTINRKLSTLNSFFKYLMKHGKAERNPVRQLHAQRLPERLPVYLKETETQLLLEEMNFGEGFKGATERLICELLYATGVRRNELLELKEKDIEWSLSQVRVLGKGNKERLLHVPAALLDALRDYLQEKRKLDQHDDNYLLNLESGAPVYAGYVYRTVRKYLAQITTLKKKSPHVLRHTFATHLLNNGANIQAIKDLLGHSSLAATQVYTHNNIDKLKEIHRQNHPRG